MDVTSFGVRRTTVVVGSGKNVVRSILDIVDELRDIGEETVTLGDREAGDEESETSKVDSAEEVKVVTKKIGVELGSKKSEKEGVSSELSSVLILEEEN